MAYDIHIIKRNNWFDKGADISLKEWREVIDEDPTLEPAKKVEGESKDGQKFEFQLKGSQLAKWKNPVFNDIVWLNYHDGEITISNPNDAIIKKAKELAGKLGAKVQGDEGEIY